MHAIGAGVDRAVRSAGRPLAVGLALAVLGVDVLLGGDLPRPVFGALDVFAHACTSALLLLAGLCVVWSRGRRPSWRFALAAMVATVLIDVDHAPSEFLGSEIFTAGTPRPYSHSLSTVLLLGAASALTRRTWRVYLAGAAAGVSLHLWRDLATAPVALFWPLTAQGVELPYSALVVSLVAAVGVVFLLRRSERP